MDVQVEELSALTRKLTITLPSDIVQPRLKEAYDKLMSEARLKGYRRGKVPRSVVEKYYKGQVEGEVGEKLVQDNYFDIVEKRDDVDPITHPEIKDVKYNDDGGFTFIAEVDVHPVFELGNYKGLEIEKEVVEVSDDEMQQELERMQRSKAPFESVGDRAAQKGDTVVVDFQGFYKGNAMPQVKQENYSVELGSGKMGTEFEEKLVGMKKDEEGTHEVDFPESHPNPMLKGKKIAFKVIIQNIKERVLPAIDDDFAKDVGEYDSLDELKAAVKERLISRRQSEADGAVSDKMVQKLLELHAFEVPNRLVAYEIDQMIKQTEQQFEQMGMSLEAAGINRDTLVEQNKEPAAQRVRGDFILKKIGEVEEIKVEEEDMDRGFKRIGDMYNMPVAKVKEFFKNRDDLLPFIGELLNEKVLNFLRESAVMIEPAEKPEEAAVEEAAVEEKKEDGE
ncbi:trigger factor [Desulforhopalus vacuolatus]|uniref:trigger factor n=1 Tax=Desulforhopalus vacuolatus TaxID=40414 RepID=UPI001963C6FA|nr:trigger factor [Desulforhopalus vacuolatus]MBM9519778.1 trigger factor [Desulforhopalus vacuolatus]